MHNVNASGKVNYHIHIAQSITPICYTIYLTNHKWLDEAGHLSACALGTIDSKSVMHSLLTQSLSNKSTTTSY
jgi:hypothetical protein